MFTIVNFEAQSQTFFLTDSKLCHVYKGPKSKKVHGTFGLGWKYQGRTVGRRDWGPYLFLTCVRASYGLKNFKNTR